MIRDPRVGYRTHGEERRLRGDGGQTIIRTDRFDGSFDSTVQVKAIKINLTKEAPPNRDYVAAIAELEEATREHRLAAASGSAGWMEYTSRRVEAANLRIMEVQ